ncbi:MAG: ferredoxin [Candidatus Paceibacteria bacterium]
MEEDKKQAEPLPQNEDGEVKLPDDLPEKVSMKLREGGKVRRIVVDRNSCIGAKTCVQAAPEVFAIDDENLAYVQDPDGNEEDDIIKAAKSCPTFAIYLYDKDGNLLFPQEWEY